MLEDTPVVQNMTLRDYIAAHACAVMAGEFQPDYTATLAYAYADAMLKERNKCVN